MKEIKEVYQKCSDLASNDLDIINLIERVRKCATDIELLKGIMPPDKQGVVTCKTQETIQVKTKSNNITNSAS
jgi:hypothetical protein